MYRCLTSKVILASLVLSISTSFAATVSWQNSTKSAPWVDKGPLTTTAWDNDNTNYISVNEQTTYQEIFGYGGCFNEKGWKCLMSLSQTMRDSVMKMLFDSVNGCNFSVCRVPIGANDYSIQPYSLDETSGDYTMTNLSITHDNQYLIPYMKAAMAIKPSLKVWGSPWSVPTWMKDSKSFNSGSVNSDAQTFTALALYFAKAVKAYQQEGLHYFAIMPTNEPNWKVSMGYPVTGWTSAQLRDFIKTYLGPRFRTDDVNAEIYMGTILNDIDVNSSPMTAPVFSDSTAYSYCSGAGYQYQMDAQSRTKYPDKRFYETETPCGTVGSFNDATAFWNYAMGNDDNMRTFFTAGVSVYSQWNMVLDTSGKNIADWRQYAMVMIDTSGKKVTFTPQFYQVRHYCYVKPGAYRIATSGNSSVAAMAFRNLDGENILIATNKGGDATVAINFNGQKIKPTIPGSSFNTFRFPGTPIPPVNPFSKVEAENFSIQSGLLIRSCSEGGNCVTLIQNNDWTVYTNVDFATGANAFEARVSGAAGGTIEVHIDSCNSPVAGTCTVPASGAWSTVSCPVTGISGKHTLYLKFKGTGTGNLFSLNWFDFTPGTASLQTAQQSASAGNYPRIAICNGLTMPIPRAAGKKPGVIAIYNLSGKLVYSVQSGGNTMNRISTGLSKGIYIIRNNVE
jgi:glucosylceramidase